MAALLYLPRLFVYHSSTDINSIHSETFIIMERRLLRAIMFPSMIIVLLSGIIMVYNNHYLLTELYFQLKLLLVLFMGYTHGKFTSMFKDFELHRRKEAPVYYRIWNEVPTCIMIFIVLLIIIKPF